MRRARREILGLRSITKATRLRPCHAGEFTAAARKLAVRLSRLKLCVLARGRLQREPQPEDAVRSVNRQAKKARRAQKQILFAWERAASEAQWRDETDAREANRQAREVGKEELRRARAGRAAAARLMYDRH